MAKNITLYNVFVASPSDVKEEREALEKIVRDFNLTTANFLSIKLELVKWETHTYPSFGNDAQDVINNQLNDDYDIFIGIMWSRFGTPTNREDSGTKEEFLRAYKKWQDQQGKGIKIMFYFKNAPILPDNIDIEQITFLKEFKQELKDKGGLYWPYKDSEEFSQLLRIHLNNALTALVTANNESSILNKNDLANETSPQEVPITVIENDQIEELGLFESIDFSLEKFLDSIQTLNNLGKYLADLTEKTNERSESILRTQGWSEVIRTREIKRVMDKASEDLLVYVKRSKVEIPLYKESIELAFKSFSNAYSIWKTLKTESQQIEEVKESVLSLKENIGFSIESTASFRGALHDMPNITTAYKKAKRQALEVKDALIKELEFSMQLVDELEFEN